MKRKTISGFKESMATLIARQGSLLIAVIFFTLLTAGISSAQVYLSDAFDDQADWAPTQTACSNLEPTRLPPAPWAYVSCAQGVGAFINSSAAHGDTGKGLGIKWPTVMQEIALSAPTSVLSGKKDLWVGFWWKHSAGWDWGRDQTHKWFRFEGSAGDVINLNYDQFHRAIIGSGDTQIQSDIPFDTNDSAWHYFEIYLKHNTSGQSNGELRLWRDGVEAKWKIVYGKMASNTALNFGAGDTFPAFNMAWGFQARPDWGSGNVSYFDDIIVASTREEVEAFLGGTAVTQPQQPPATPTQPEPAPTPGPTQSLLAETFEDTQFANRGWYDNSFTSQKVVFDKDRGENVLEIEYTAGASTPISGSMRHLITDTEKLTFSYKVKYSDNWAWTGKDYGPHEFYFLTNADSAYIGPARTHLTIYSEINNGLPTVGMQDGENIDINNISVDLANITEKRSIAGCNGEPDTLKTICYQSGSLWYNGKKFRPSIPPISNNQWHDIKLSISLNTIVDGKGVANGYIQYWLDGERVIDLQNILFRTAAQPDLKINQLMFGPYYHDGVPQTQKFWIDNISIDTIAADIPSPPTGLKIVN